MPQAQSHVFQAKLKAVPQAQSHVRSCVSWSREQQKLVSMSLHLISCLRVDGVSATPFIRFHLPFYLATRLATTRTEHARVIASGAR